MALHASIGFASGACILVSEVLHVRPALRALVTDSRVTDEAHAHVSPAVVAVVASKRKTEKNKTNEEEGSDDEAGEGDRATALVRI